MSSIGVVCKSRKKKLAVNFVPDAAAPVLYRAATALCDRNNHLALPKKEINHQNKRGEKPTGETIRLDTPNSHQEYGNQQPETHTQTIESTFHALTCRYISGLLTQPTIFNFPTNPLVIICLTTNRPFMSPCNHHLFIYLPTDWRRLPAGTSRTFQSAPAWIRGRPEGLSQSPRRRCRRSPIRWGRFGRCKSQKKNKNLSKFSLGLNISGLILSLFAVVVGRENDENFLTIYQMIELSLFLFGS